MQGPQSATVAAHGTAQRSRVTLVLEPGGMTIDGAWWPRTDSLVRELPALDVAIAQSLGAGISRFSYVLGSWSDRPRRVRATTHLIKLGWFSHGASPDNVELSLDDYRRVVLKVIPADTPADEAESFLSGVTVLTSWSDRSPSTEGPPLTVGAPGPRDSGATPTEPEPADTDPVEVELPAVGEMLDALALIDDPAVRERAARRVEWRAIEWALAAARVRWAAHADAMETAGEPPPSSSPPWN